MLWLHSCLLWVQRSLLFSFFFFFQKEETTGNEWLDFSVFLEQLSATVAVTLLMLSLLASGWRSINRRAQQPWIFSRIWPTGGFAQRKNVSVCFVFFLGSFLFLLSLFLLLLLLFKYWQLVPASRVKHVGFGIVENRNYTTMFVCPIKSSSSFEMKSLRFLRLLRSCRREK